MNKQIGNILGLAILFSSANAAACSCVRATYEELVDRAKYVFVAQMISANYVPSNEEDEPGEVIVGFKAIDVLKGDPSELKQLVGGVGGGDCGFPVVVGRYLLVQTDESGWLSICHGTRVAHVWFEEWDVYLEGVRNYIENGTQIEPLEGDEYGPISHGNEEY